MSVFYDHERKAWRYEFQHQGTRYQSKRYTTKREAREEEHKHRHSLETQAQTPTGMAFSVVANSYLDYAKRKFAELTYNIKAKVFADFLDHLGCDPSFDTITPFQIHEFLNTRPTNAGYNASRKELSTLWQFARKTLRVVTHNIVWDLDKMPHTPAEKIPPTEEEVLRMIAATNGDGRDLILVVLLTLARIDEILRLKYEDCNFTARTITLWTRKRKNGEWERDVLPMNEDLYKILWRRWENRKQDTWVFFNENKNNPGKEPDRYYHRPKFMAAVCRRAGITPLGYTMRKIQRGPKKGEYTQEPLYYGWHHLRHFMATYLVDRKKVSKKTTSGLLRHRNLGTTEIYFHSVDETWRTAMSSVDGIFTKSLPKVPPTKKEGAAENRQPLAISNNGA